MEILKSFFCFIVQNMARLDTHNEMAYKNVHVVKQRILFMPSIFSEVQGS